MNALDGWDRLLLELEDADLALADVTVKARHTNGYRAAMRRDDLVACGRLDGDGIARAFADRTYGHRSATVVRVLDALDES